MSEIQGDRTGAAKKRVIKDPEDHKKPPLRISHIVYGREKRDSRVYYLVDPKGEGTEKKIAEQVVLLRWRRRAFPGFTFSGSRLNSGVWRVLPRILGDDPTKWLRASEDEIQIQTDVCRESMRKTHQTLPAANVLKAIFEHCGGKRLSEIIKRHNDPARVENFGTPDLFLYAIENKSGKVAIARFVEVKKPEEALSTDQKEEIAFLQSLGLHARVLRLIERETAR
jgi:hypothetical protein